MKTDPELEVFIKLKYFPIELTDEYYSRLPCSVFHAYKASTLYGSIKLILNFNPPNQLMIDLVEDRLFRLLSEYHQLHGYDYNENGEII